MKDVAWDLGVWIGGLLVVALIYSACPSASCEDAVQRCAVSDGTQCSDVSRWCK